MRFSPRKHRFIKANFITQVIGKINLVEIARAMGSPGRIRKEEGDEGDALDDVENWRSDQ